MIGMSMRPGSRAPFRAATLGAVFFASMIVTSPAMALTRDDGDDPGEGLSKLKVLGIFIGLPVLAFAAIWVLVSIPSMVRGPRYRPGKEWQAEAEWYGAPGDEVEGGQGAPELEAGSSDAALTGTVVQPAESDGGGTSARW